MKNNFLKVLLVSCFLALNSYAHATIVDNNMYTTDTSSGLDWLDWDLTNNMSGPYSKEFYAGWRYATGQETHALMGEMGFGMTVGSNGSSDLQSGYEQLYLSFVSLFGLTQVNDDGSGVMAQVDGFGAFGVRRSPHNDDITYIYKDYSINYFNDINIARDGIGIALVRSSASVPEPSSLAIFALGALAMVFRRFKYTRK